MNAELSEAFWIWSGRILTFAALAAACASDLRSRRIPNALTVSTLFLAMAWHAMAPSGQGLFDRAFPGGLGFTASALGAGLCLVLFVALYALRVVGAGDAKLMAAMGAVFGIAFTPGLVLCVLVSGGLLGVARMLLARTSRKVWENLLSLFFAFVEKPSVRTLRGFDPHSQSVDRMPYALAIASGSIVYAMASWFGWITLA